MTTVRSKKGTSASGRCFAIGDIHGNPDLLKNLIEALQLTPKDELVFLGDYIDRGPDSKGVIDYLINLSKTYKCTFVRGNHEEFLIKSMSGDEMFEGFWLKHGGRDTLKSYDALDISELSEKMPASHKAFFEGTVDFYETDTHIYTHASWNCDKPSNAQDVGYLRYIFMDAAKPSVSMGKTIVVGHSALMSGKPAQKGNFICIDTMEYGWLTAFDVKGNQFIQSDQKGAVRVVAKADQFSLKKHVPPQFRRKKEIPKK